MSHVGKRMRQVREGLDRDLSLELPEAIKEIKSRAVAKFDESVEIAMRLGVDPRHADQMVRGMASLPNGTGKTVRVAVFAKGDKVEEAQSAGADIVGGEELAKEIQDGRMDFDRCIATPDMMAVVGRLGRILGPRGMMPNPKLGTVTNDLAQAIQSTKSGAVEFRVERAGQIHAGVGKASFGDQQLTENILAFVGAVQRAKPSGAKGTYVRKIMLSSTMGPSVRLDVAKVLADASAA